MGKVTILDLESVRAVGREAVVVSVSSSLRKGEFLRALRRAALHKLEDVALAYAVDLTGEDIVFTAVPGKADAWGCKKYRCRWEPTGAEAEFVGGPKDGTTMVPPSPRTEIVVSQLAPGWQEVMAGPEAPQVVPKVEYRYRIAGYNLTTRRWVFRLQEGV